MTEISDTHSFLFARWVGTCYEGVLNSVDGKWWRDQLKHFNDVVYPNYTENGTVENTNKFLNEKN